MMNDENLKRLGCRLRTERLRRNDTQAVFAARMGASVPTLRKMEMGDGGVLIGYWCAALDILDRSGDWDAVLAEPEDLFAKYERATTPVRQRTIRRRP